MLLGPVLDVVDNPNAQGEGDLDVRVFGGNPQWIGEMGRAYIRGIHIGGQGQVITVAKHFPGHGDSNRATDRAVAVTNKSLDELLNIDLVPFLRVTQLDENDPMGTTDAIMSSHIAIASTGTTPISLFYDVDNKRGGLVQLFQGVEGFRDWYVNGFVVSDSLGVGAIKNEIGSSFPHVSIASQAFLAGNDLLIFHNFVSPSSQYEEHHLYDEEAHSRIQEVIEFFQQRYLDGDPQFVARINEAVTKIVKAKLQHFPELSLESVFVDQVRANALTGTEENIATADNIAQQSIALLKPSRMDDLPQPPSIDDNIVFIRHNFVVPSCEDCSNDWLEQTENNFIDFLIEERGFRDDRVTMYNYYRINDEDPAGISTLLYGWYLGVDHSLNPISDEEIQSIRTTLKDADWVIFLFVAGDCGPDSYKEDFDRCQRGRPEADTLHYFLQYSESDNLDAKIVAIAFGAPPWHLDSTDAGHLNVYYGAFSQLESFQHFAVRALLREIDPLGKSPVDVESTGYYLRDVLVPDPTQLIELQIKNESFATSWHVGDTINLQFSDILDMNGNVVVDGTLIEWQGSYLGTDLILSPQYADTQTTNGQASATFMLSQPGQTSFTAQIDNLESESLVIEIQEQLIPVSKPSPETIIEPSPTTRGSSSLLTPPAQTDALEIPSPTSDSYQMPDSSSLTKTPNAPLANGSSPSYLTFFTPKAMIVVFGTLLLIVVIFFFRSDSFKVLMQNYGSPIRIKTEKAEINRTELLGILTNSFNESELKTLVFNLGIEYEDLEGNNKSDKARELILHMERRGALNKIIDCGKELREDITWPTHIPET